MRTINLITLIFILLISSSLVAAQTEIVSETNSTSETSVPTEDTVPATPETPLPTEDTVPVTSDNNETTPSSASETETSSETTPSSVAETETNSETPSPELQRLQQMYIDYLTEQGYKAELTENKYIIFKRQGHTLFIDIQEKDLAFFRVALPNIWPIETEEERAKVLVASDRASSIVKVAKVYTVEDDVWICVELFVNQPEDFKGLFERSLSAIEDAVFVFTTHMRHENLAH